MARERGKPAARVYGVTLAAAPTRCGAKTRAEDSHPCRQYAVEGTTRCRFHGGASPQAKRKARERIAEERAAAVLRTQPAEPVTDAVSALRRLCAEVLRNADAQLEAGQTTGSTTGEWIDRASRLLVELARIDGAYIDRSAVLFGDMGAPNLNLDAEIEAHLGNLISKPAQARLNSLYDALDAEAAGQDVDEAVDTSLEDAEPEDAIEATEVRVYAEPPPDAPEPTTVLRLGKLPPGFGTRRSLEEPAS